jgi:hypothetical protein
MRNGWAIVGVLLGVMMWVFEPAEAHAQRRARPAAVCVPGAQVACACPGGTGGAQRCNSRGTGLEPCDCPDAAPRDTPAPVVAPVREVDAPVRASRPRATASSPAPWGWAQTAPGANRWYGWQILAIDLGAIGLSSLGGAVSNTPGGVALTTIGGLAAFFGGPIVHWAHGYVGRGFASMFGLRLGLPLGGGLLGASLGCAASGCRSDAAIVIGAGIGVGLGWITGLIVDIAVLAYDDAPRPVWRSRRAPATPWTSLATVSPWVSIDPARGHALFGVGGRF